MTAVAAPPALLLPPTVATEAAISLFTPAVATDAASSLFTPAVATEAASSVVTSAVPHEAAQAIPTLPVSEAAQRRSTSAVVISTTSFARDTSLPLRQGHFPSPPRAETLPSSSATLPDSFDSPRINSLHLPPQSLAAYRRLCEPISHPPARTIELSATFGWTHPTTVEKELLCSPAYPEDDGLQHLYETFLRSQTGESRDHYNVFFAQLAESNDNARAFMQAGRKAAAQPLAKEMEEVEWDPEGDGLRFRCDGRRENVPRARKRFSFAGRVSRAFVRGSTVGCL